MPKTGMPCDICNKPVERGVPTSYGKCCEDRFLEAIAKWYARESIKKGLFPI